MSDSADAPNPLVFEQPLNERVRTYLRLEFLFSRLAHHRRDASNFGRRAAIASMLDILLMLGRSDIKSDIIKELGEQRTALEALRKRPAVDEARLDSVLAEMDEVLTAMQGMSTQFASAVLRDNDFLISVANRSAIPGGTCAFDLPNLHRWLSLPEADTQRDLDAWLADLAPYERAIRFDLRLTRDSVAMAPRTAEGGVYVQSLNGPCRMLRVALPPGGSLYPEISAGKHRFTIRFMQSRDLSARSTQATELVNFDLAICPG